MRYVKGNNSLFIVGEDEVTQTLSQLEDFGQNLSPVNFAKINTDTFSYNKLSSKNVRLHSKKVKCILECMHLLNFAELKIQYDSERIGVYINASQNDWDFEFPKLSTLNSGQVSLFDLYRANITPTHNIKNSLGTLPGHICIYHEIHGPSFAISSISKNQIINKAKMDLNSNIIDLAVIAIVNSYEDPMTLSSHLSYASGKKITEAAGVILLTTDMNIDVLNFVDQNHYYGYLEGFIPQN